MQWRELERISKRVPGWLVVLYRMVRVGFMEKGIGPGLGTLLRCLGMPLRYSGSY